MAITMSRRPLNTEYWRLRTFFRDVFLLNQRRELSWQVARLDYWLWFINAELNKPPLEDVFVWEDADGGIVGVVNAESPGDVFLQVHPKMRSAALEAEMIGVAEAHFARTEADGKRSLHIWAHAHDTLRTDALQGCGYTKGDWPEYQYVRSLEVPIPAAPPAHGYIIRALGDADEIPARSWLSWRVFHPDEPASKYIGYAWYPSVQRCPMYRRDLDLVAVTTQGEMVGFCTLWYDDVTRTGCFEPVGVAYEHHRRGLGKALLNEGLRRIKHMGAVWATVAGYSEAATALYRSVMGDDILMYERWNKNLTES